MFKAFFCKNHKNVFENCVTFVKKNVYMYKKNV